MAQTLISGTINSYKEVTAIDAINQTVTLNSVAGLANGDKVLLIQMKGAAIDETQSSSFGTIDNFNNAGNYEIKTICDIQGSDVSFKFDFVNSYDVTGIVQLVTVPVYTDALISGADLTADAWDGAVGGVLALEVTGNLDFGMQDIDVSGLGFRGAEAAIYGNSCNAFSIDATYYTSLVGGTHERALKGEGIAVSISSKECGRGPQANGGGGGNGHNGGGGGGSSYGTGGAGGADVTSGFGICKSNTGVSGHSVLTALNTGKVFLGGGGGSGHVNNTLVAANDGLNGGGLVVIMADEITGNGRTISANGGTHTTDAQSDGGGGGGGGGTVVIHANTFTGTLNVSLDGGDGADSDVGGTSRCHGPGGGGAGGALLVSQASIPGNLIVSATGGSAGVVVNSSSGCLGSSNGGTAGAAGGVILSATISEGITATACGLLPVEWLSFNARRTDLSRVRLEWATVTEENNMGFAIEKSADGLIFEEIGFVGGAGDSDVVLRYSFEAEATSTAHFRLKQIDFDGKHAYSSILSVEGIPTPLEVWVSPNPTSGQLNISLNRATYEVEMSLILTDMAGKVMYQGTSSLEDLLVELNHQLPTLPEGIYGLRMIVGDQHSSQRLLLR